MSKQVILVFDNASWLDANRSTFYKNFNNHYQVICISMQSFVTSQETPENIDEIIFKEIKNLQLKNIDVVMGLSINGVGITNRTSDFFNAKDIPLHIWYWDYPEAAENKYTFKDNFFVYHASQDYYKFFQKKNVKSTWLPFATSEYIKSNSKPIKNIMFIGALWHINQIAQNLSAGLKKDGSEKIYHTKELLEIIHSDEFLNNKWRTRSEKEIIHTHVLSALSAIKRAQYLS